MANKKATYHVKNGNAYDTLYLETILSQVIDSPIKSLERSTAYKVNDVCSEATLPKGGFLVCTTAGTTDSTVPTAFGTATEGATITDGAAKFKVHFFDQLASLVSPTFTGTPAAPTATTGTNTTQIATTAFVQAEVKSDNNKFKGATASAAGKAGLAPAPSAGTATRYLRSDGTWQVPPDTNTTYSAATQSANGLMTAADKKKLDGIATGANAYTHPNSGVTAGTYRSVTVNTQGHVTAGSNPTITIGQGGTGATTAANAVKALLGSSAIGSSTKPLYYDGAALKACADSIGGGGIVAQLLEENGYVKFANGLILQWGYKYISQDQHNVVVTYPITVSTTFLVVLTTKNTYDWGYNGYQVAFSYTESGFTMSHTGIGQNKYFLAVCKA